MDRIYLDYAASTPVDPEVFAAMEPYFMKKFGNPGSLHAFGQEAIAAVDRAREAVAASVGADFRDVIFTASATEANNLALRSAVRWARESGIGRPRIVVSAIEHESVLETARDLERDGAELVVCPVDGHGVLDIDALRGAIDGRTAIVSVMAANNEIGTIEPAAAIAEMIRGHRAEAKSTLPLFHADAAQAFQFFDCRFGADFMTISSHKIYGPKGAAALIVDARTVPVKRLRAAATGGGQEFGLRSGTENVPAIVGFAKAAELTAAKRESARTRIGDLRDALRDGIRTVVPGAETNGFADWQTDGKDNALPSIFNVFFPNREAQDLLTAFDLAGLAAASGSACHSRALEPSYVIEALGHAKERARSSIRFSLGRPTTAGDIEGALRILRETFSKKVS
ncbi:MAG TPA: cysteine desulfurase family protein [Candidatus Paceibacterota bacterium]|nr:cysteine desulfurase family protein [Candidatus Paceibacterota bacterium]